MRRREEFASARTGEITRVSGVRRPRPTEDVEAVEPNELLTRRLAEGARDVGRAILGTEGENFRGGRAFLGEEGIEQPAHALRILADEVMGDEHPLPLAPFDQPLGDQDIRRLAHGDAADAQVPAQRRLRRQALPRRR